MSVRFDGPGAEDSGIRSIESNDQSAWRFVGPLGAFIAGLGACRSGSGSEESKLMTSGAIVLRRVKQLKRLPRNEEKQNYLTSTLPSP